MIVLGFDTATQASAVGLRLSDRCTLHASDDPAAAEHPGHATRLLSMARELLAQADLRWNELERIAVGVGPGRFTGLRVGIATARGLAQSLAVELVGVSSLRALGLAAAREARDAGQASPIGTIAVIDARRGESFAAAYPAPDDFAALAEAPRGADPQPDGGEIAFARALRPDELSTVIAQIEQRGGPQGMRWRAVGDGALLYADALRAGGVEPAPPDSPLHLIDGAAICELGAAAAAAGPDEASAAVLPDYRRSPDAALARSAAPGQAAPAPASTTAAISAAGGGRT